MLWHSFDGTAPHRILEVAAYAVGARIYWARADRTSVPASRADRALLLGSALCGAFAGSALLHDLQALPSIAEAARSQGWSAWWSGKSVLGGFIGGTLAVECAKKAIGWKRPTGDAWVPAIAAGLVIGRAGCQLSGLWDQTYGIPTALPWAWDYGDGEGRHPVALYEMLGVALAWVCTLWPPVARAPGAPFAALMADYAVLRFVLEFLKPPFGAAAPGAMPVPLLAGLTAIQWAALAAAAGFGLLLRHRLREAVRG